MALEDKLMRMLGYILILCLLTGTDGVPARAEDAAGEPERTIFRRFDSRRVAPTTWQVMPEFPVWVRPVDDPDADVTHNGGFNLVIAFRPNNRIYMSRSYDFAKVIWHPRTGTVRRVEVTSLDISEMINFSIKRVAIMSFGLGIGLMDGLVQYNDGTFQTRLEPFVPIQLGLGFNAGESFLIGFKLSHHLFLGPGPVLSLTRGLIGIGYSY